MSEKKLPGYHRGHEALGEMAQPVKMVSTQIEGMLYPIPGRHPGIGVMAADNEDEGMEKHETVEEGSEGKASVCGCQDRDRYQDREDLEQPGFPVKGVEG